METLILLTVALAVGLLAGGVLIGARLLGEREVRRELHANAVVSLVNSIARERARYMHGRKSTALRQPRLPEKSRGGWVT